VVWAGLDSAGTTRIRFGEELQAHVAAAFGPFVVLFGRDGADEPDEGAAAGEDAEDVGVAAVFLVEAFWSYLELGERSWL